MKLSKINILEALKIARSKIDSLDSELLLSFVKKVERSYLVTHEKEILTANEKKLFLKLVDERESKKPLAYLINQKGFWKNDFYVDSSVLIPRPETELLVEKILEHNLDGKDLLELGVGSGIISISLGLEKEKLNLLGTEKSLNALMIANKNSIRLQAKNIVFINHDWNNKWLFSKMDYIVSNPPYVDENELEGDEDGIWYEPKEALFSKDEGMKDLKTIISKSFNFLKNDGLLFLEHSPFQAKKIIKEAKKAGYSSCKQFKDYNGLLRISVLGL